MKGIFYQLCTLCTGKLSDKLIVGYWSIVWYNTSLPRFLCVDNLVKHKIVNINNTGLLHKLSHKLSLYLAGVSGHVMDITSVVHLGVIKCFGLVIYDTGRSWGYAEAKGATVSVFYSRDTLLCLELMSSI